jgi:hypothetical protein
MRGAPGALLMQVRAAGLPGRLVYDQILFRSARLPVTARAGQHLEIPGGTEDILSREKER